jgi:hypothetical protein
VIQIQLRRYGIQIVRESIENVLMNMVLKKILKKQIGKDNFSCFFLGNGLKTFKARI